jgi:membrane protease subunit HflC
MNKIGFYISSLLLALLLLSSTIFVVDQRQYGVVYSLGQIKKVITEPGLNFKLPPPFQNVNFIDKRLLTLDNVDSEPMLTAEKQRMVIDWYVRWRISDPSQYIRNVGLDEKAGAQQLTRVVRNAFQEEINKRTVKDLLSLRREALMVDVKREVLEIVKGSNPWGIDVVDVRITRADYVDTITESVYRRMEAERKRVANELRSTGGAEGEKIRADADRQREVTLANAYRDAQKIKGEGDAEAARLYADAFGKDAQFAQFYQSLEAYKSSFNKKSDVMVLDPSSDFFKAMRGGAAAGPSCGGLCPQPDRPDPRLRARAGLPGRPVAGAAGPAAGHPPAAACGAGRRPAPGGRDAGAPAQPGRRRGHRRAVAGGGGAGPVVVVADLM